MLLRKLTAALIEKLLTIDKAAKLDLETGAQIRTRSPNGGAISKTISTSDLGTLSGAATRVVNCTASTLAITDATHHGKTVTLNRAAGIAVTLPAATGSGLRVRFFCGTTVTSNAITVKVANASDTMVGGAVVLQDGGDTMVGFEAAGTADTVSLNGSTTGGIKGDEIVLEDVAANLWKVWVTLSATGVEATPFSATVA